MKRCFFNDPARDGSVMMSVMVLFGILSIVALTMYTVASTEVMLTGRYIRTQNAFFDAEAGIQQVKADIERALEDGSLVLDEPVETVFFTSSSPFNWKPVRQLAQMANSNLYSMVVTGQFLNAEAVIEALIGQKNLLLGLGVYGDKSVRGQPNGSIRSYQSSANPVPVSSSGQAGVGSNESIVLQPGSTVDGGIFLGLSEDGSVPVCTVPAGIPVEQLNEHIEADPLGAQGGNLADLFTFYSSPANNNNANAVPPITGNTISDDVTLPPGSYYIEDLVLGPGETMELCGTPEDPVVIYFSGDQSNDELIIKPNAILSYTQTPANPNSFLIFSDTENDITLQPNQDFQGMIYAPYAEVLVQPNNDFFGTVWAGDAKILPGGDLWIDMLLVEKFKSVSLEIASWKELRDL